MRGASALQGVLDDMKGRPIRALVVWEPVLPTDVGPPTSSVLSKLRDERADQFWDPSRVMSDRVLRAARQGVPAFAIFRGEQRAAWDLVAVYPPGVRWQGDLPAPVYCGNPVVESLDSLRARLASAER